MNRFTSAVIVCAGNSSRFGCNKILLNILKKPSVFYTVSAFESSDLVDEIILVCRKDDEEILRQIIKDNNFTKVTNIVHGSSSRQKSVLNGVNAASKATEFIAIHDGARILITKELIDKAIIDAYKWGASVLGVPSKDTIKILDSSGFVKTTPKRESLWNIQTPQVFEKSLYNSSIEKAMLNGMEYSDDCQLLENNGIKVHVCMGDYSNIKLTTKDDLFICESILKKQTHMEG